MTKSKKHGYSGILSQPIIWQRPSAGLLGSVDEAECQKRHFTALVERIIALYKHYGVDHAKSGADVELALAMARDHVPGFQVLHEPSRRRGRPSKWKGPRSWNLYADVTSLVRSGHSEANACRLIS